MLRSVIGVIGVIGHPSIVRKTQKKLAGAKTSPGRMTLMTRMTLFRGPHRNPRPPAV